MATKKKKKFVVSDELQQRIDNYHSMLDISPDPTVMYDPQGQVVYVNPAFTQTFGWELGELFGSRLDFVPEEAREATSAAVADLLKEGESAIFTTRRLTKQGNVLDVQNRGKLLKDEEGQMLGSLIVIRDITLQKDMERALQASEARYREILETIKEGYYEVDLAGSFIFMNDQAIDIFGYAREKFMGLNFREYTSPETADLIYKTFNRVFRTGEPIDGFTYPIVTEEGEERFIEVSASLVKDEEDQPVGFRGIVRNVTERIQAEETLRQSEERYRTILENIEDGYYETNLNGEFVFMNEQWAAFHAYSIAEMMGTNYRLYAVPELADKLYAQFNQVFQTGVPVKSIVNEVNTKDGRRRHLDISASLIYGADGKPTGFRGVGRDVTDRILAEEQLRVSEERYRTILESIEEGYYESDLEGSFTFINDQLCEVIGYPREELMGMNYREYTSPETAERVFSTFNRVFKTGEPVKGFVWDAFGKDGRVRHLETYVLPNQDENGETIGFRGVGRDITQRVQAEEALAEALIDQERIASQLATVAKVSTAVSTILNPQDMLQAVVDQVKESFKLYHAHIYLLNKAGDTLELAAGAGEVGHQMVKEGRRIPLAQEQSLVARAARSRSGVIVNDVKKDPHFLPHPLLPDTHAEMAVPMTVGGQVLGVLDLQADMTDRFTQRYANIQTTLATQVAVALQNARLFAQAQQQTAELQETTNLLDQVVDILPIGLFMKDAQDLRFVRWNKANEDIMGLKHSDVVGKNDYDFFPQEEADFFTQKDREVLAREGVVDIPQETLTTPHRGERLLHTRKLPILGADGTPRYLLGVAEDITERKQAEELLQESLTMQQTLHEVGLELAQAESLEDLFAQAVTFCRDRLGFERAGIFTFDAENRRFIGTFGINTQGELTDERATAFISEGDFLAQFDDARQRVFTRHDSDLYDNGEIIGRGWHLTVPLRQDDRLIGVLFSDALVSHRPLKPYEPDLLAAYGGTVANQMVRIQAEIELQETNARAQAILESVTTPMLISAATGGQILYANELLAELVEVPLATLLEQGTPDFYVRQEDRTAVVGEIQATGAVTNHELELKRSSGEQFWAMLSARLFSFQNTPAILTTLIDITERRQAQEAIRLSEQNLQESLRMQQTLHEVGLELAKAESLDELFRVAIVLAQSHLEFQRIGLFRYDGVNKQFVGTYGRDLEGKLRDEKDIAFAFPEEDFEMRFGDVRRRVIVEHDIPLQDVDAVIGHGWHLTVPIRKNEILIGALFAQEPLFARRPLRAYEPELLASFSAILTNLIERLQNEQAVQESLRLQQVLHEVNLELSQASTMDELFRQVVHLGEKRLHLERFALFLYNEAENNFSGTYGTDIDGNLRDEHGPEFVISVPDTVEFFRDTRQRILVQEDCDLWDQGSVVGQGWLVTTPVRHGNKLAGILFTDNLISQRPFSLYLRDLTIAYSNIIASLMERKRAEEAIRQNEALLRTIINATPDWIFIKDREHRYRLVNQSYANDIGLLPAEFIGQNDLDIGFPEEIVKGNPEKGIVGFWADDRAVMDSGQMKVIDVEPAVIDGETRYLNTIKVPLRDQQDQVWGVLGFVHDITDAKRAEEALAAALAETEHLYTMSARLNAAASIDDIMEAVVLPLLGQRLTAANLFTLEVDANGRPEWMEIAAAWASQDSLLADVDFPIGSRFYVPDLAAARLWIDNPQGMGLIGDVDHDEELDDVTRGIYQMTGVKAGANLALRLGDRWVGMLALTWAETQDFTENDVRLYRSLAEQTAIILNNQLLFEQLQKRAAELATVAEVGAAITSIRNVNELLQRVVDLAKERFGLYHAHIYLLDDVEDTLVLTSGAGDVGRQMVAEGRTIPLSQTQSLIARAVRTRQGVIVHDVTADKDFLPHVLLPATKSEMAVPMIVGDEVLGVLDIQANRVNRFSEEDVQIQTTLAAQIGVALQNAHSFARSETALKELEEATRRLRREGWQSYLGTDGMSGLSYGYDQKEIKPLALATPKSAGKRSKKADTPAAATLTRHLQVQGEPIGSLTLVDPTWAEDDADDIMTAVAERLSAHIENLRLSEQTEEARQQAESLFQGSTALNTAQNYDDVLTALRENSMMGHESVSNVSLNFFDVPWDADHTPVWIEVLTRWSRLPEGAVSDRYALENFPSTEKLLRPDAPVIIEDVAKDKRLDKNLRDLYKNRFQAKSTIYMPLVIGSQWVGYINAIFAEKVQFPEDEIRRLTTLSQQAAVTIQSIRLFAQAQARAGELSVLNEMVSELTTMLEVEPILEAIYHYATRLMDTTNFYIAMQNPLTDEITFPIAVEDNKRVLWRSRPFGNGMTEYLLQSGQPLFVEDGLERWLKSQGVESIGSPSQSWMGVPLRVGGEVTGVIALQDLQPRTFTRSQFDLLNAVANQAAIAIQNARQFQQEQTRAQRQQMLREIAAKVRSSADIDAIMRTAVQEIGQALGRQTYVYLGANSEQQMDEGV